MTNRTFVKYLLAVVVLGLSVTIGHLIYAVHAYQHCSIIYFIAKELW